MSDQTHSLRDDIAFMRALAEEGRQSPLLGGSVLAAAGLIFGTANGLGLLLQATHARPPAWMSAALPLGALALFMGALALIRRRIAGRPGAGSPANRATAAAWRGIGWAILVLVSGLLLAAWRLGDWRLVMCLPILVFALYGAGFHIAARMSRQAWLSLVSWASYGASLGGAALVDRPLAANALFTAGLFLLVALPGVALMRQAPSDIV